VARQQHGVIRPKHAFSSGPAAAVAFLERRAQTTNYVRDTDDPLRRTPSRIRPWTAGRFQWLLMLAHHSDRHVRQIERAAT
jgi:hypothetical protein